MLTFAENQDYGDGLRNLEMNSCYMDLYIKMLLPVAFYNLSELAWTEPNKLLGRGKRKKTRDDLEFTFTQKCRECLPWWGEKLRSLTSAIGSFPFETLLLESSVAYNLTNLCVSFQRLHYDCSFEIPTIKEVRPAVKSLIQNLENAPVLENLTLQNLVMDLDDMEELHSAAPELTSLKLERLCVYSADTETLAISADGQSLLCKDGSDFTQDTEGDLLQNLAISFYTTESCSNLHTMEKSKETIVAYLHRLQIYQYQQAFSRSNKFNRHSIYEEKTTFDRYF